MKIYLPNGICEEMTASPVASERGEGFVDSAMIPMSCFVGLIMIIASSHSMHHSLHASYFPSLKINKISFSSQ